MTEKLKNCKIAKNHPQKSDFDILVATPYALEGLKLLSERGKIGLAIFISIEPLISIPDFRSGERVFNKLNFWKILCRELRIPAIILQAYSPENLSIRAFCYGEYEQWVKSEKENRKHFFWPPYSTLIKLWPKKGQSPDTEETIKEIKKCFKNKSKISGPFKDSKGKNSILIKLNKTTNGQSIKKFAPQWAIDRNPENIL